MGRTWTALICMQVAVAVGALPAVVGLAWNYIPPPTPTFPASDILSFEFRPPPAPEEGDLAQSESGLDYRSLQAELLRRTEAIPGVTAVTFASASLPIAVPLVRIDVEDPTGEVSIRATRSNRVDINYFAAFGGSLLAGRTFNRGDAVDGATAVIVNRAFVDEYLTGGEVLGRRFREVTLAGDTNQSGPWFEVVGVIENMLLPSRGRRPSPHLFHPIALGSEPLDLMARTEGIGTAGIIPHVREIAEALAPGVELRVYPLAQYYDGDPAELRLILMMVGLVTLSVLLLSAAGVSAMMSFAVIRRRREVGIRVALGASSRQVITFIFSRSTRQLGTGLLFGAAAAAFLDRSTGGDMLDGEVAPLITLVAGFVLLSGLLATLGPTRRALRIQPMEALREE